MNKPTNGNLPAQRRAGVADLLEAMRPEIAKELSDPKMVSRFISLAIKSTVNNSALNKCSPESIVAAVRDAAAVELEIDGVLGHAYIVPYKGRAQLQIGYKGLIRLAQQGGTVHTIRSAVVYEGDVFEMDVGAGTIKHVPCAPSKRVKDGDFWVPIGAYAIPIWTDRSAPPDFEWMWVEEINMIQERSPSGKDGPWVTDWEQMARKCPIRRLCSRRLQLSTKAQRIVSKDDLFEHGIVEVEGHKVPAKDDAQAVDALDAMMGKAPAIGAADPVDADTDTGEMFVREVRGVPIDIASLDQWRGEECKAPEPALKGKAWAALVETPSGPERGAVKKAMERFVKSAQAATAESKEIPRGWQQCILALEAMERHDNHLRSTLAEAEERF